MTEADLRARVSELEAEVARLRAAASLPRHATVEDMAEQVSRIARGDAAARASSAIAHDLRNVFQVIHSLTTLVAVGSAQREHLDTLDEAMGAGKRLLFQLSNVSHGVVVEPRPIDLSERVSSLKRLLHEVASRSVHLEERLHPGPCRIVGDPTQIDQILLNLVKNSVDAMPRGGNVLIETRVAPVSELLEPHRPRGAKACSVLRVVDDGPGISKAVLPRVFDARVTTKAEGQGLGLATVKAIVDSHRGTIRLASTSRGTTFELAFPAAG